MNDDFAKGYSLTKWLRFMAGRARKPLGVKAAAWIGGWCLFMGIMYTLMGWSGLAEWWRIVNLSYEEVSNTPYLPIWTSGYGMIGIVCLLTGSVFLLRVYTVKKDKAMRLGADHKLPVPNAGCDDN